LNTSSTVQYIIEKCKLNQKVIFNDLKNNYIIE
jgi:hypothetical protein